MEQFFKEKQPEDIAILIEFLEHHADVATLKAMADASRDEKWRPSLRTINTRLYNMLVLLESTQDPEFARQILRLSGNLCIDDLSSKTRASEYLGLISECLWKMPGNFDVAAGVITNIFTENSDAPADLAIRLKIPDRLAQGLVEERLLDTESPIGEAIFDFLTNIVRTSLNDSTEGASPELVHSILVMATFDWDYEQQYEILTAVVILLSNKNTQSRIANFHSSLLLEPPDETAPEQIMEEVRKQSPLLPFISVYQRAAGIVAATPIIEPDTEDFTKDAIEREEDDDILSRLVYTLQNLAGDIACTLEYRTPKEMLCDPVLQYFKEVTREDCMLDRHLESSLAFLFLGNIARNSKTCLELVRLFDFHERAISLIGAVGVKFCEARYLAVGYLYNLANVEQNKAIICVSGIINQLMNPQYQEILTDGLRLLRSLVKNSVQHCRWLLFPPTDVPECLVRMSHLEHWLPEMISANKNEMGRLIVTVLRTLQMEKACSDLSPDVFMTQALTDCLLTLTEQGVRSPFASEGILGFGLASSTPKGAKLVLNALQGPNFKRFLNALGDESSKQDIENALVVLSKIHEHCPSDFDMEARSAIKGFAARIGTSGL